MTDMARLEERLAGAFVVAPDAGFDAVDRRIAALVASPAARPGWRSRRSLPFSRRVRLVLAVGVALLAMAGAAVGAMNIVDHFTSSMGGGTRIALDRGVVLDQRQVQGDHAVTLVRGYSDISQVILLVIVERVAGSGPIPGELLRVELRDPSGALLRPGVGSGDANERQYLELIAFTPASGAGEFTLRLGLEGNGPLPWTFRFSLPVPVGTVMTVDRSATNENGTVRLGEVRLSPTEIRATLHIEPIDRRATWWVAYGYFEHDGQRFDVAGRNPDDAAPFDVPIHGYEGTESASGSWTLVVNELVGEGTDAGQIRPQGPWRIPFSVP